MLQPMRTKFRKAHKGRIHGDCDQRGDAYLRPVWAQGAGAGAHHRASDRGGAPRDHAPDEALRAGSGSGCSRTCRCRRSRSKCAWARARATPEFWVCRVKPGRIMFEIDGVTVCRWPKNRWRSPPPSCRSRPVSSSASANRRRDESCRHQDHDRRPDRRRGAQAEEGAVQPALPARHRPTREHRARAGSAPRHRALEDHRAAKARHRRAK